MDRTNQLRINEVFLMVISYLSWVNRWPKQFYQGHNVHSTSVKYRQYLKLVIVLLLTLWHQMCKTAAVIFWGPPEKSAFYFHKSNSVCLQGLVAFLTSLTLSREREQEVKCQGGTRGVAEGVAGVEREEKGRVRSECWNSIRTNCIVL